MFPMFESDMHILINIILDTEFWRDSDIQEKTIKEINNLKYQDHKSRCWWKISSKVNSVEFLEKYYDKISFYLLPRNFVKDNFNKLSEIFDKDMLKYNNMRYVDKEINLKYVSYLEQDMYILDLNSVMIDDTFQYNDEFVKYEIYTTIGFRNKHKYQLISSKSFNVENYINNIAKDFDSLDNILDQKTWLLITYSGSSLSFDFIKKYIDKLDINVLLELKDLSEDIRSKLNTYTSIM